ncbi:hypothetical protein B0H17DRAFT_949575 [Mycena rosella]|uniref:Uncharacterized protein n=1 Tax=Mycena rosella TaxID=1033263 RepID=A0AAD7CYY5_MYCRO|nr:hypothetical protein B0H17DRAFT_949575 [Mycena rosella]
MQHELDARIRSLPLAFGVRHFPKGISLLSQISGSERKAMACILLGCLVGKLPAKGIRACRSILDFIYLAQYSTHDDGTLSSMRAALNVWHADRDYFITATVRKDFNIPKFHSLLHYIEAIEFFGTTDNYNTEMFERLHIDFAKNGWRASNRRDEFPQMITWLARQEKISSFATYLAWLESTQKPASLPIEFLNDKTMKPTQLLAATLPFNRLNVYHNFKFEPSSLDPGTGIDETNPEDFQTVTVRPPSEDGMSPARFDTVIARCNSTAGATGLSSTRVGRVKVLFRLPDKFDDSTLTPSEWPKTCLAYVEWFTTFKPRHEENHDMYSVMVPPRRTNGFAHASIIPLTDIRQTCQLFPNFGRDDVNSLWTSDNVLDECRSFFVNNWASLYAYQSIW